jgi:hemolysin D
MKSARAAISVAKNVISFPLARERREKHDLDFLPAALEIVETPPSPIGRAIGASIVALFCLALIWASLGKVDIAASAPGRIVPNGRVKLIQAFETGVVRAIDVRDGQRVKAGDKLIELDPTMTEADQDHIRSDLIAAQLDIARLRAELSNGDDAESIFRAPESARPELIATQRQFLAKQIEEYRTKLGTLDRQRTQKEAERDTVAASIAKLQASQPILEQRLDILKTLSDKGLGSKLTYLEALQLYTDNQQELVVQKSRLNEAGAAVAAITEGRAQEAAEFQRRLFADLTEAERKAAILSSDLVRAEKRTKLQVLTAPVDGVVQQLAVHTIGGVVSPAQQLAVVVPSDSGLEVEAMISNGDIGFVHAGQEAQIKVDTFPYTRYGLLEGRIITVSQDAVVRDIPSEKAKENVPDRETTSSEPKGQEFSYVARVSLDNTQMQIDDVVASVLPGMAVTVEIKTGSRTILSYVLSPLQKYRHDILRER